MLTGLCLKIQGNFSFVKTPGLTRSFFLLEQGFDKLEQFKKHNKGFT